MRVLLVDDSGVMRRIQIRCFNELGITEIVEASNGQEAIQLFSSHSFDIVMTDWNMPEMSGLELLRAIREQDPDIPVLMVTTESTRGSVVAAIVSGVSDYLVKPFSRQDLESKIRRWCLPSNHPA